MKWGAQSVTTFEACAAVTMFLGTSASPSFLQQTTKKEWKTLLCKKRFLKKDWHYKICFHSSYSFTSERRRVHFCCGCHQRTRENLFHWQVLETILETVPPSS